MSVIQKSSAFLLSYVAVAALLLTGCSDPASRALLKGEKLIQHGQYTKAIAELETATRLLPRNAQAWNHLGLALHYQKQYAPAQQAYRQALAIDHNLASARFNLGNLLYEHSDFVAAIDQLTSYTLLQPRSVDAWLKLGSAQLQAKRYDLAERSFRAALELQPGSCEALNGLGNVAFYRRRVQDALNYFSRALALDTNYAPAILNSAVVAHQSLNNRQQALHGYRNYLALVPQSQSTDAVKAAATQLETELAPPPSMMTNRPALLAVKTNPPPAAARVLSPAPTSTAPILVQRPTTVPIVPSKPVVTQVAQTNKATQAPPKVVVAQSEIEVTKLPDDLVIRPVQDLGSNARGGDSSTNSVQPATANVGAAGDSSRTAKSGLLARLNPFNGKPKPLAQEGAPKYAYLSPARPGAGNRSEAEKHFAAAVKAQRSGEIRTAFAGYKKAVEVDPAYFEAHYNRGLAAYEMGNWQESLRAYEYALALRPDSIDARYNFALALKAANYLDDAAQQLAQILQTRPDESRAHLSLGNLYAYKLNQPQLARQHFSKVLEYDPQNPQASEIRFWLASHP
ncbi:MAG TPA: tetratricopeptide repeat protein [Verrucomicrobiae bacterium]|nr:tetratricopeptide repeat protein [Verrucomicrobiae bacterium]